MIPPHVLTNFKILTHYQNRPRGVYSQNDFPDTVQDEVCIVDLVQYSSIGNILDSFLCEW